MANTLLGIIFFYLSFVISLFSIPSLADEWADTHGGKNYDPTLDAHRVLCVYPLSGQYSLLNRLLYYFLIVFCVVAHQRPWLVTGPLAYVMIYSTTSAVHAMVMTGISKEGLLDIDTFGAWAIVSVACLAILPIFLLSKKIRESQYIPAFGLWDILVSIGAICSLMSVARKYPDEPECRSSTRTLLTSQPQLFQQNFNCSYTCFATTQALRAPSEIIVIAKSLMYGHWKLIQTSFTLTLFLGILGGIYAPLPLEGKRTEAELKETIDRTRPQLGDDGRAALAESSTHSRARDELQSGEDVPAPDLVFFAILACPTILIVIILNEVFMLAYQGGFPTNEKAYAIGQWGPWVGVLLAFFTAFIIQLYIPHWEAREKILKEESEARERRKEELEKTRKQASLPAQTAEAAETQAQSDEITPVP